VSQRLAGRVALVTGAAGDGAGQATVRRLLREGAAVAVTDVHERRTSELLQELRAEHGDRVAGALLDVGSREQIDGALERLVGELGAIDILVNNAALNVLEPVSRYRFEDWDTVMEADLGGCFRLIRHVLPGMMERGWGSIVNVTSVAAFIGNAREGPYAAAKAALHSLTRSVAVEGGPHGVRCNAVAPGIIKSKFVTKYEESFQPEVERTPMRRLGEPEDVANAVAFLVSEESSFITGEVLNVSGGWYMRAG
jgi:NAD(P)-dependent dehydrogenase (short-subunit alcohol dehydrogenase family)